MDLQTYIESKRGGRVKQDIRQRWSERVVPQGLHTQGRYGAFEYLNRYGKSIAAPKCVGLALCAEAEGASEMALGFWEKAYELEIGPLPTSEHQSSAPSVIIPQNFVKKTIFDSFPLDMQPGELVTMQPVDAECTREQLINSDVFAGQPKVDGVKAVVFVDENSVLIQSRSLKVTPMGYRELADNLREATRKFGPFILEGELTYLDVDGGEHRTAAQAATANVKKGHGDAKTITKYAVFSCLFSGGTDWRDYSYMIRISEADRVLDEVGGSIAYLVPTFATTQGKQALCDMQLQEGREGEIWFDKSLRYHPGKQGWEFLRTKYLIERLVRMYELTPTTAEGRLFGAIKVCDEVDGRALGTIGTGFDRETQRKLVEAFNEGKRVIPIVAQGYTENGMLWHARLSEDYE